MSDPLQLNDPWQQSRPVVAVPPVGGSRGHDDPLIALETRVIETVLSKLPPKPESMEVDHSENARVTLIEQRVQELSDGQHHLHAMIQEQGSTHGGQLHELRNQANRLEVAVGDQSTQLGLFQNQFRAQLEQQQGQLDSLFQQQMSRIEDILKRQRHE